MTNKIMVIDKEWAYIAKELQVRGYDAVSATSEKALEDAILYRPDLIVLGTDYKLCECLKDKTDIPIVMLADKLNKEGILKALKLGCIDLLEGTESSVLNKIITHLRLSNIETITKQLYKLIN